ncbi:hypothetical protein DL89DRAFT_260367 [Linderina pennispora]|uniref:Uncharacterized protein n=1 Tax=Linderina pennispora TaxID=61395 RepID=A0A1Y1VYL2_9FUNG|nr:uncharacterized protein DL89DRAFT_260367 [Linderina pennispora]ORX66351.1 hypothetical protein DL89DRAFT_260367 [Linderina pennispora]
MNLFYFSALFLLFMHVCRAAWLWDIGESLRAPRAGLARISGCVRLPAVQATGVSLAAYSLYTAYIKTNSKTTSLVIHYPRSLLGSPNFRPGAKATARVYRCRTSSVGGIRHRTCRSLKTPRLALVPAHMGSGTDLSTFVRWKPNPAILKMEDSFFAIDEYRGNITRPTLTLAVIDAEHQARVKVTAAYLTELFSRHQAAVKVTAVHLAGLFALIYLLLLISWVWFVGQAMACNPVEFVEVAVQTQMETTEVSCQALAETTGIGSQASTVTIETATQTQMVGTEASTQTVVVCPETVEVGTQTDELSLGGDDGGNSNGCSDSSDIVNDGSGSDSEESVVFIPPAHWDEIPGTDDLSGHPQPSTSGSNSSKTSNGRRRRGCRGGRRRGRGSSTSSSTITCGTSNSSAFTFRSSPFTFSTSAFTGSGSSSALTGSSNSSAIPTTTSSSDTMVENSSNDNSSNDNNSNDNNCRPRRRRCRRGTRAGRGRRTLYPDNPGHVRPGSSPGRGKHFRPNAAPDTDWRSSHK